MTFNSLKAVSDQDLHQKTIQAANNEKNATLILFEFLAESDSRRLYAKLGYTSLFEYAHKALGYSEPQASERVNSMRLAYRIPEVKKKLEDGEISLTTVLKLSAHVRREKLESHETVELLNAIAGMPTRKVDQFLAEASDDPARPDRARVITKELTRITMDVDQEFMELLTRMRELNGSYKPEMKELIRSAMKEFLKKRGVKSSTARALRAPEAPSNSKNVSRYIPASVKRSIRLRSGDRCEFVNEGIDERRCDSKKGLQFDHIIPFAFGGTSTFENLRHFCPAHNRLSAIQVFSKGVMKKYLE